MREYLVRPGASGDDAAMASKSFARAWLAAYGLVLAAVVAVNLIVDPYDVFGSPMMPMASTPNTRFSTYRHYIGERERVTVAVIGSSRVGFGIREEMLNARFAPDRFAAIWGQAATPPDAAAIAAGLLRDRLAGRSRLATLVVFVDLHTLGWRSPDQSFYVRQHPEVAGDSLARFYFDHLVNFAARETWRKIRRNLGAEARDPSPWWERRTAIAPPVPVDARLAARIVDRPFFDEDLHILQNIAAAATAARVRAIFILGPTFPQWRETIAREGHDEVAAILARRVPIIFFPGVAEFAREEWWADGIHFAPELGARLIGRALGHGDEIPDSLVRTLGPS